MKTLLSLIQLPQFAGRNWPGDSAKATFWRKSALHFARATNTPGNSVNSITARPANFAFDTEPKSKDSATFTVTKRAAIQFDTILSPGMKRNDMTLEVRDKNRLVYSTLLRPDRLSGRTVVHPVLSPGQYTLTLRNNSRITGKVVTGVRVSPFAAPSRLEASVWGGKTIRLNGNDNSNVETGFVIDKKVDGPNGTHRWVRAATADANATAAVVDGLDLGTRYQFRLTAVGSGQQVSGMNLVAASTSSTDTTGWYKVSSLGGATKAYADWRIKSGKLDFRTDASGSFKDRWVFANSWQMAVISTIEGGIDVRRVDGSSPPPHVFASEGSFKIGTGAEIKATVADFKLPANNTKMIVLEDSYGEVDRDYDDFWWGVSVDYACGPDLTDWFLEELRIHAAFWNGRPSTGGPLVRRFISRTMRPISRSSGRTLKCHTLQVRQPQRLFYLVN